MSNLSNPPNQPINDDPKIDRIWRDWFRDVQKFVGSGGGGGGGGVTSVTGGTGISVSPTTGAAVVTNTGVTSIVAGSNITISSSTGAVTINSTGGGGGGGSVPSPSFRAHLSSTFNLSGSTFTKVPFNTVDYDVTSNYNNTSTYAFTPNVAGYYQINSELRLNSNSGYFIIALSKNGTQVAWAVSNSSSEISLALNTIIYLNGSTDSISIVAEPQNAATLGGTGIVGPTGTENYFQATLFNGNSSTNGSAPAFSAYASVTQTFTSGVFSKVNFDTKEYDVTSNFDNSTNFRFTPNLAGYYQVNANIRLNNSTFGFVIPAIYKNGIAWKFGSVQTTNVFSASVNATVFLNGTTDYIEIWFAPGGNVTTLVNSPSNENYFQATWLRG